MKRFKIFYKLKDASVKEKVKYIHEIDRETFQDAVEYSHKYAEGKCMDEANTFVRNDDHPEYRVVMIAETAQVIE